MPAGSAPFPLIVRREARLAEKLVTAALEFLASEHAGRAVAFGWSEMELFAIFNGDLSVAGRRRDALGLIPSVAHHNQHTYTVTAVEADQAILTSNGGARLAKPRRVWAEDRSVPFWDHPAFRGRAR